MKSKKLNGNLFSQMASSGWWIDNFVIENGKVESQSQPNRMSWLHFRLWYVKGFLISFLRILNYAFCLSAHKTIVFSACACDLFCVYVCVFNDKPTMEKKSFKKEKKKRTEIHMRLILRRKKEFNISWLFCCSNWK